MIQTTLYFIIAPILISLLYITVHPKQWKKVMLIVGSLFIIMLGYTYLMLPSRTMKSIMSLNFILSIIIPFILQVIAYDDEGRSSVRKQRTEVNPIKKEPSNKRFIYGTGGIIILLVVGLAINFISGFSPRSIYQSIDKTTINADKAPTFNTKKTVVALSPKTVSNRVNKAVSMIPNSQYYKISSYKNFQAQIIDGKPYYIIPIEFQDFASWFYSKRTLPGYFKIDATNPKAMPTFVKKEIKYAPSALFNQNAERKMRQSTFNFITSNSEPVLEIDDNGTPYFIETLYQTSGLSNKPNYQTLHVAVMNAQTGKINIYPVKQAPKFIDECITSDIANEMNIAFGSYNHGIQIIKNKKGRITPTGEGVEDGVTSIFNNNQSVSYFADFTNINSDNDSGTGYSMIDARTGQLTYYKNQGMMDAEGAVKNANQEYMNKKWTAAMPIIYNISGKPTWVMQILDKTHALRGYYYLDANNQTIYGDGSSIQEAFNSFNQALANSNDLPKNTEAMNKETITGIVDRMAIIDDNVLIALKGSSRIYTINPNDFSSAALTKVGDKVKMGVNIINNKPIGNVKEFKNETFTKNK